VAAAASSSHLCAASPSAYRARRNIIIAHRSIASRIGIARRQHHRRLYIIGAGE